MQCLPLLEERLEGQGVVRRFALGLLRRLLAISRWVVALGDVAQDNLRRLTRHGERDCVA